MAEENPKKDFLFPTVYKAKIGSYLSWPVGAKELTETFEDVPQAAQLYLEFGNHLSYHQGKWPSQFVVMQAIYNSNRVQFPYSTDISSRFWHFHIYPVPRNAKTGIREALKQNGFKQIRQQLMDHAHLSSKESYWRFELVWNSELEEFSATAHDYLLPETSVAGRSMKKGVK